MGHVAWRSLANRLRQITYPYDPAAAESATVVTYSYGPDGGIDDIMGRVVSISSNQVAGTLERTPTSASARSSSGCSGACSSCTLAARHRDR